jgi:hypothetical protein
MRFIPFFIILFTCFGCFEFSTTKKIPGPYYLLKQTCSTWDLYYGIDGPEHGRIISVENIGWTDNYIFAEAEDMYYLLDKRKDSVLLNKDEIVIGPLYHNQFMHMVDSLGIKNLTFKLKMEQ